MTYHRHDRHDDTTELAAYRVITQILEKALWVLVVLFVASIIGCLFIGCRSTAKSAASSTSAIVELSARQQQGITDLSASSQLATVESQTHRRRAAVCEFTRWEFAPTRGKPPDTVATSSPTSAFSPAAVTTARVRISETIAASDSAATLSLTDQRTHSEAARELTTKADTVQKTASATRELSPTAAFLILAALAAIILVWVQKRP